MQVLAASCEQVFCDDWKRGFTRPSHLLCTHIKQNNIPIILSSSSYCLLCCASFKSNYNGLIPNFYNDAFLLEWKLQASIFAEIKFLKTPAYCVSTLLATDMTSFYHQIHYEITNILILSLNIKQILKLTLI